MVGNPSRPYFLGGSGIGGGTVRFPCKNATGPINGLGKKKGVTIYPP